VNTDKRSRDLTRVFPDDPDPLSLPHDRLAATAQQDRILDIAYRTIDSPVGALLLAATEPGLIRVAHAREGHDAVLQALADKISPRILRAPARPDMTAPEFEEYLAGRRHSFDLPLDWRLAAGFRRAVLSHLPDIGYGHIASYAAIARLVGHPRRSAPPAPPARPTAAGGAALPPCGALPRQPRRLPRRRRRQAHPAHPANSSMNPHATQPGRPVSLPDR
jgi:methylated-DNA-[protein]-cysteine S-methyltransferase